MSNLRFPNAKYVRQLRTMHAELTKWRATYVEWQAKTSSMQLAGRFAARASVLDYAIEDTRRLINTLYELPRLS